MLNYIYSMNLWVIAMLMPVFLLIWSVFCSHLPTKTRVILNGALFCISTGIILYATLLNRTHGTYAVSLFPFSSFITAKHQPELYREMLMNVFLFFPLGLTLSNALLQPWHCCRKLILVTLLGCLLSVGIEYSQYRFALGMAETNDVICNTLGTLIGATSPLAQNNIRKGSQT